MTNLKGQNLLETISNVGEGTWNPARGTAAVAGEPSEEPRDGPLLIETETADSDAPDIGKWLRMLRAKRGLPLERLAKESGVSRAMLSQIELGNSQPTIKVVWRIARALQVPISTVLGMGDIPEPFIDRAKHRRKSPSSLARVEERPLFPLGGHRAVGFYELRMKGHTSKRAGAQERGTVENIVVTSGILEVRVGQCCFRLEAGDAAFFLAVDGREFRNPGSKQLIAYLVVCRDVRANVEVSSRKGAGPAGT